MAQSKGPYKVNEVHQYTTTTVYDEEGVEVAHWRNFDDTWYDSEDPEPLTEDEIADYFPDYAEEDED